MSQYAKEIKHILAALNEPGNENELPLPDEEEMQEIHVYPVEGGGILFTREPLEDQPAAPTIDSQDDRTTTASKVKTPPPFVLFLLLLCVFVLCDTADSQLLAFMTPTVTVTIVPKTQTVTTTADLPAAAIRAHLFAPLTLSMSQTVPATGIGHQDAQQATGTVTFYNGLFTPQYVGQGTVFAGSDGVNVATTQPATIPPGNPTAGYGTATVTAQAVQKGSAGNIAAGDINITIKNGLLVKNSQFSRGQDARTFSIVTQADIQQVVAQLTSRLLQSEQAALSAQIQTGEQLFTPTCPRTSHTDRQPGDEATEVKVSVSETCAAGAYNQQALQEQGEQLLNAKAGALGKSYRLTGDIHATMLSKQDAAGIRVQFTGIYLYQINQQELTRLIAGQAKPHALLLLRRIPGIQQAAITGISDDSEVPVDTTHIHIILLNAVL